MSKKTKELGFIEALLSKIKIDWVKAEPIEVEYNKQMDYIVTTKDQKTIAIEVTELVCEESKEIASCAKEFKESIWVEGVKNERFFNMRLSNISIFLNANDKPLPCKRDYKTLAKAIVGDIVGENLIDKQRDIKEEYIAKIEVNPLSPERVMRDFEMDDFVQSLCFMGIEEGKGKWKEILEFKRCEESVKSKSDKVLPDDVSEAWLLVYITGSGFLEERELEGFPEMYDKIYVGSYFQGFRLYQPAFAKASARHQLC